MLINKLDLRSKSVFTYLQTAYILILWITEIKRNKKKKNRHFKFESRKCVILTKEKSSVLKFEQSNW